MEDLSSLVSVRVLCEYLKSTDLWVELLKGIAGAKSVSISMPEVMVPPSVPLPNFPNLKHLELKKFNISSDWLLFSQILESSSELEHLCIEERFWLHEPKDSCWIEPQSVPPCMLKNLRTIKFANCKGWKPDIKFANCKGWKSDIQFLGYMLGNAEVLRTVTIMCDGLLPEEEMKFFGELLKLPKASRYCETHFHGSSSHSASS